MGWKDNGLERQKIQVSHPVNPSLRAPVSSRPIPKCTLEIQRRQQPYYDLMAQSAKFLAIFLTM